MYLADHDLADERYIKFKSGWRIVGFGLLFASGFITFLFFASFLDGSTTPVMFYIYIPLMLLTLLPGLFLFRRDKYWMIIDTQQETVQFNHARYQGKYDIRDLYLIIDGGMADSDGTAYPTAAISVTHDPSQMDSFGKNCLTMTKVNLDPKDLREALDEIQGIGTWKKTYITEELNKWKNRGWCDGFEQYEVLELSKK